MVSLIDRYRERLPVSADTRVVSLGEGSTPLLPAPSISRRLGVELYLKWEGANPTGSFKDRGMTVAISKALGGGASTVICASTGNTAASAAAYAARAGIVAVVLQPEGAVSSGKLAQARALGARVLEVRGSFDEALAAARELADRGTHVLVNSLNPDRLEGQKTAAFEIVEELGSTPDVLALPYGGGGNVTAYGRGFAESDGRPRLVAGEAAERRTTVASAIRIGTPAHASTAAEALASSGGSAVSLADEAILEAWRELARDEGVFCEPSSAAGLAALGSVELDRDSVVVCVVTGHGLKDPDTAARLSPEPVAVDPDPDAIAEASR
ncbi:MAG TPA: threonine synthase [Gaiella sp.]|jgi:threonine synthase|nr:threonine synthase [Gaiella sp.]